MSSHSKINFSLRPAKHAERKMFVELFAHLNAFSPISSYRYIGFGSYYFSDFSLFHRQLGFKEMVNIERDTGNQQRYVFNCPYGGIRHIFKDTSLALPEIPIENKKNILWLDYLCRLNGECLTDIEYFCNKAPSGSMILVSVNAKLDLSRKEEEEEFRANIHEELTSKPAASLAGDGFHKECVRIMRRKIDRVLLDRAPDKKGEKFKFRPLINISYSDGAEMATYGGLIYSDSHEAIANSDIFSELPFVRETEDYFRIDCPVLTFRELRHIESVAGANPIKDAVKRCKPIPRAETEKYLALYRYYPNYTHSEVC